jgi:hypothetical protein
MLADHFRDDVKALALYHRFKAVIARLQDDAGLPLASWQLTSADVDAALDELFRKSSPTWPYAGRFAVEMERQLRSHAERGNRAGWMAAAPEALMGAIFEQADKLSNLLFHWDPRNGFSDAGERAMILKRCAHIANFTMMVADRFGALPEPREGQRLLSEMDAGFRQTQLMSQIERFKVLIGANPTEDLEAALERYTAAVQLGCARKLELLAEKVSRDNIDAKITAGALFGGASHLRSGLPEFTDGAPPEDVVARWKREKLEEMKAAARRAACSWWHEARRSLPGPELETLLEAIDSLDPELENAPESIIAEKEPSAAVTDEGRAAGCLDTLCGDCDMK